MYIILLVLGLLVGAAFLAFLLIGDWREARREAQRKAMKEQIAAASALAEDTWPPPPSAAALPPVPPPAAPPAPVLAPGTSRRLISAFFRWRNYAAGTVIVAFILSSSYPHLGLGRALLLTALAAAALEVGLTLWSKMRRSSGRS